MSEILDLVKKLETFTPGFSVVWEKWMEEDLEFGDGTKPSEHSVFLEYSHFIAKNLDDLDVKRKITLFEYVEATLKSNNDNLSNAIATCLLENLVQMYTLYKPENYFPFLGEESKAYSQGWDDFNGRRTKGLW